MPQAGEDELEQDERAQVVNVVEVAGVGLNKEVSNEQSDDCKPEENEFPRTAGHGRS